jgi:aspirochlorine biosynthesis cytochrome P450 monooxygenase
LKYEHAVIEESLRIFPPGKLLKFDLEKSLSKPINIVSVQSQRVTGPKGHMIAGRFVPGKTLVSVAHMPIYCSPDNFRDPEKFVLERWMGDERYKDDRRKALHPFSLGPRNCIGLHLAYAEMRIILARLIWNFDMELCEESKNWADGMKVFMIYQRAPLMVKLTLRLI